jgi:PASTA domain-containing protein
MAVFSFTLDSFQITDTRSLHQDTDYVTFTLLVKPGGGTGGTPRTLTKSMGDVNNGVHGVNLTFSNITVNPTDTVVLNYLIVNSGHKTPSQVVSAIETAGTALLSQGVTTLGNLIAPGVGSILGKAASWLGSELLGVFTANCDGPVAAEQDSFTFADLTAKTSHGPFSHSTKHPGTDSPTGCGRNSVYIVNWHMLEVGIAANKTVPNVLQLGATEAASKVQAAGLVAKFSGQNGAHSFVFSQSPSAGQVVDEGSAVSMVLHQGPAR